MRRTNWSLKFSTLISIVFGGLGCLTLTGCEPDQVCTYRAGQLGITDNSLCEDECHDGNSQSCLYAGRFYKKRGLHSVAARWYDKGCEMGDADVCSTAALFHGISGELSTPRKALHYASSACELDPSAEAYSCYQAGMLLDSASIIRAIAPEKFPSPDDEAAAEYYALACSEGANGALTDEEYDAACDAVARLEQQGVKPGIGLGKAVAAGAALLGVLLLAALGVRRWKGTLPAVSTDASDSTDVEDEPEQPVLAPASEHPLLLELETELRSGVERFHAGELTAAELDKLQRSILEHAEWGGLEDSPEDVLLFFAELQSEHLIGEEDLKWLKEKFF